MTTHENQIELFRAVEVKEIEERRELRGYSSFLEYLLFSISNWYD